MPWTCTATAHNRHTRHTDRHHTPQHQCRSQLVASHAATTTTHFDEAPPPDASSGNRFSLKPSAVPPPISDDSRFRPALAPTALPGPAPAPEAGAAASTSFDSCDAKKNPRHRGGQYANAPSRAKRSQKNTRSSCSRLMHAGTRTQAHARRHTQRLRRTEWEYVAAGAGAASSVTALASGDTFALGPALGTIVGNVDRSRAYLRAKNPKGEKHERTRNEYREWQQGNLTQHRSRHVH